jgi:hypothetical protein
MVFPHLFSTLLIISRAAGTHGHGIVDRLVFNIISREYSAAYKSPRISTYAKNKR